jgi:hypothetical protein
VNVAHDSYDPAGDIINQTLPVLYAEKVKAWQVWSDVCDRAVDSVVGVHKAKPVKEDGDEST